MLSALSKQPYRWCAILIILAGFALRLHHLGGDSLWIDELLSLLGAKSGWSGMLSQKDHPPLYYILLWFVLRIFGESEFTARLLSLWAGTLALPLVMLLGRQLRRPKAGLWTAVLLALSPFHLRYSQEVRHYALLMMLALLTFVLLHRALAQPTWFRWLNYAIATLATIYLHYGGLLILAAQSLLIAVWLKQHWPRKQIFPAIYYPLGTGIGIFLLYLPWLPRLTVALNRNMGADIVATNRGYSTPILWAQNTFYEFGTTFGPLPYILLGLSLTGLLLLLWQKDWRSVYVLLAGLLPFFLVFIFQIARQPLPRYIIYIYPFYLLAIGIAIAAFLQIATKHTITLWLTAATAIATLLAFLPQIQAEYQFVQHDWRGILNYLQDHAQPEDTLVGMTMNFTADFNVVTSSLPYYLTKTAVPYNFLPGNQIGPHNAPHLAYSQTNVWGIVMNWAKDMPSDDPNLEIVPFSHDLYIVRQKNPTSFSTLERTIDLYQKLIFLADTPSPACQLHRDLANLYVAKQDYNNAHKAAQTAVRQCPSLAHNDPHNLLPYHHHRLRSTRPIPRRWTNRNCSPSSHLYPAKHKPHPRHRPRNPHHRQPLATIPSRSSHHPGK